MTKVINFWAGPGAGKSTCAADLFAEMKWQGHSVELISEFAKEATWDKHFNLLQDQLFVSAQQNRRLQRLIGQVDYIITDSPLLLCVAYIPDHYKESFKHMICDMWNQYDNANYFIDRRKAYVPIGRSQTEDEARAIDMKVINLMRDLDVPYKRIVGDREAKFNIIQDLRNHHDLSD